MHWLYFASGSILLFTSLTLLQRKLATDSTNPRAMAVAFNLIAAFLALLLFFLAGSYKTFQLPTNPWAYVTLIIAALSYGLFERGRFIVAKINDASVLSVVSNLSVLIAFTGSFILYSEVLTIPKVLGASLIIAALVFVSINKVKTKVSAKGLVTSLLVFSVLGIAYLLDKQGTIYFNANSYSILVWILPVIVIIFPSIKFKDIQHEWKRSTWKIWVLAALNVMGYLLQLKAFENAEATRVIPFLQISTLLTVIFGIMLLGEKDNILRKIVAGILAIAGVYLLV